MNTIEINNSNLSVKYFGYVAGPLTIISVLLPLIVVRLMNALITIFVVFVRNVYLSYAALLLCLAVNLQEEIGFSLGIEWNSSTYAFLGYSRGAVPTFLFVFYVVPKLRSVITNAKAYRRRRLNEGFYVTAILSISRVVSRREKVHLALIFILAVMYLMGILYDGSVCVATICVNFIYGGAARHWDAKHAMALD